jgi:hypothetical protein
MRCVYGEGQKGLKGSFHNHWVFLFFFIYEYVIITYIFGYNKVLEHRNSAIRSFQVLWNNFEHDDIDKQCG